MCERLVVSTNVEQTSAEKWQEVEMKQGRQPEVGQQVRDESGRQGYVSTLLSIQFVCTDENGNRFFIFYKDKWRVV